MLVCYWMVCCCILKWKWGNRFDVSQLLLLVMGFNFTWIRIKWLWIFLKCDFANQGYFSVLRECEFASSALILHTPFQCLLLWISFFFQQTVLKNLGRLLILLLSTQIKPIHFCVKFKIRAINSTRIDFSCYASWFMFVLYCYSRQSL